MLYQRLKIAKRKAKRINNRYNYWFKQPDEPKLLGKYRKTKRFCSCWMCGNPRRHFNEKTIQEKKADDDYKQQLDDLLL